MHESDVHIQTAVGQFIRERRKLMGMNLEEFSEQIGVHSKTFNRIEMGYRLPTGSEIFTICRVLDITPNELLSAGGRIDIKDEDKSYDKEKRDEIADIFQTFYAFLRLSNRDRSVVSDFIKRMARSSLKGKNLDRFIEHEDSIRYMVVPHILSWGDASLSKEDEIESVFTQMIYNFIESISKGDSDEILTFTLLFMDSLKSLTKESFVKGISRGFDISLHDISLAKGEDPEKVLAELNALREEIKSEDES